MSRGFAGVLAALLAACAYANGYDPSRYADAGPVASVDPETEPLPPSPRRRILDPRGAAIVKAPPALAPDASLAPVPVGDLPDAAPVATCGTSRADFCPLQGFMQSEMATAHTASTLTTAFTLLAGMSPDNAWGWTAIATRGADLANAGDLAAAKAQCAACHDVYREAYRRLYRARRL